MNAEQILSEYFANEIANEIDKEIMQKLMGLFPSRAEKVKRTLDRLKKIRSSELSGE